MDTDEAHQALDRATAGFRGILAGVSAEQWDLPTPNPGWSVRELVNHVVGGNRRYLLLLAGAPTAEVEKLRDGDQLGADPLGSFDRTSAAVAAVFREPGALERTVHHRKGDRSGDDLLTMRILEHALHGWDLATAVGADTRIGPSVVAVLLDRVTDDLLVRSGYPGEAAAGPAGPAGPASAPGAQQRLLALTGRG
jgi:uncharacterized protein (TIGR03086 family)